MASFWIKNRVWNKADDFATSSLLYERCNISPARPMRNYELWNRNALMECLENEKGVRVFTELLRRSYSFILCKWWDIVGILQQPVFYNLSFKAFDNWSGQDVGFMPQRIPSRREIASCTSIPSIKWPIPCKFPLHPPVKWTLCTLPSTISKSICLEQTPDVL